jgi:hypothetical protein
MKAPQRFGSGNLVWTLDGVWAVWRVAPWSWHWRSTEQRLRLHEDIRRGLMALPEDSLILSVCAPLNKTSLATGMLVGTSLGSFETARSQLEWIDRWGSYERRDYIALKLGAGIGSQASAFASQTVAGFSRGPFHPTEKERLKRHREAADLSQALGRAWSLSEPDAGEVRWLLGRALHRGITDLELAGWHASRVTSPAYASAADVVVKDGGDKGRAGLLHRYLQVEDGDGKGYQCHLTVAEIPEHDFPDDKSGLLAKIDTVGFPVDYAVRIHRRGVDTAIAKATKKAKGLAGQSDEQMATTFATGTEAKRLARAKRAVQVHLFRLDPLGGGEMDTTIVFTVWSPDLAVCQERAKALESGLGAVAYGVYRPIGGQIPLLKTGLIGVPRNMVAKGYAQRERLEVVASLVPFAGTNLGTESGPLLGACLDGGVPRPVLFDPALAVGADRSGSIAICGSLGGGKTYTMKLMAAGVLERGGRGVVLDRTDLGEWGLFADAMREMGHSTSVVRIGPGADVSFSPIGIFRTNSTDPKTSQGAKDDATTYATGVCELAAQTETGSMEAISIQEAVDHVMSNRVPSMGKVLARLETMADEGKAGADTVSRKLASFARSRLGRLIFDDALPSLNLDADFIAFLASDLTLPDREQMKGDNRGHLLTEQVGAMVMFYVVAAVGRAVTLADKNRFAFFGAAEAWALTDTPQGAAFIATTSLDGRKRNAAVILDYQDPSHLSDESVLAHMTTRFVFAQGTRQAARRALEFVSIEPTDDLVEMLLRPMQRNDHPGDKPRHGLCFMQDFLGQIGKLAVAEAPTQALRDAFETNPHRLEAIRQRRAQTNGKGHADAVIVEAVTP